MVSTNKTGIMDFTMGFCQKQGKQSTILKGIGRDREEKDLTQQWDGLMYCWQYRYITDSLAKDGR